MDPVQAWLSAFLQLAVMTAIGSIVCLWVFRRAVKKAMAPPPNSPTIAPAPPPTSCTVRWRKLPAEGSADSTWKTWTKEATRRQRRLFLVYLASGTVWSIIISVVFASYYTEQFATVPSPLFFAVFAYPLFPTARVIFSIPFWRRQVLLVLYLGFLGVLSALFSSGRFYFQDDGGSLPEFVLLPYFWFVYNFFCVLLAALILSRRIAAVGSVVAIGMLICSLGMEVSMKVFAFPAVREFLSNPNGDVDNGLRFLQSVAVVAPLGFIAAGYPAWMVLKRLRGQYQRKKLSDQSLQIATIWLIHSVFMCIPLGLAAGGAGVVACIVAFVAFLLITNTGRKMLQRSLNSHKAPNLLFLRVFKSPRRRVRFLDSLGSRWRHLGPIHLIVGPDIATAIVAPHQFLDFINRRLPLHTISDGSILERRLGSLDAGQDPDTRYRINDFLCSETTWKETIERLVPLNDVAVMDLRGYSRSNLGSSFEVGILARHMAERTLFVIDKSTEISAVEIAASAANASGSDLTPITLNCCSAGDVWQALGRL